MRAQPGAQFEWVKTYSHNAWIGGARSVAQDSEGNVYSTGMFLGNTDIDPGPNEFILSAYDSVSINLYIQKLDANGDFIWAKSIGNQYPVTGDEYQIVLDEEGNILIAAFFKQAIDLDPGPDSFIVTPSTDAICSFVVKLDSDGEFIWGNMLEASHLAVIEDLGIDQTGNIFLTGRYDLTLDADPSDDVYTLSGPGGNTFGENIFIIKWEDNGNFLWANSLTSDVSGFVSNDLSVDINGNVIITGQFRDTVDFDPGPEVTNVISNGNTDVFLLKLDSNGDFVWVNSYGGEGVDKSESVCTDSFNNIFISGGFSGTISFDASNNVVSNGEGDIFILKTDANGLYNWARTFGGTGSESVYSLNIDNSGSLYTVGSYTGILDIDPNETEYFLDSEGETASYFQKLNTNGDLNWAISFDFSYSSFGNFSEFVCVGDDNIYMVGTYPGEVDFNPSEEEYILNLDPEDSFVLKLVQDSCSNLLLYTDSISSVSCNDLAYISVHGANGVEPYSYVWDNNPLLDANSISPENPGLYSVTVTDSTQCVRTSTYLISGPIDESGFDLNANLIASNFQPGFSSQVIVDGFNSTCENITGEMILVFDELLLFESSLTPPDETIGDSLIWEFADLNYDAEHILADCFFTTSITAAIGDTICFDLIINPTNNDLDSTNNVKHYCFPILNGYDPNDKQVYPQGQCDENYTLLDETLTYTIRFQNTGNSEAINIHNLDQISPYLNINTVNIVASSHEMYTEVKNGNVLDFIFNDINLPDSSSNLIASQGYVIFEIDPILDIPEASVISNESNIYFDYNPPIQTNMVFNTMVNAIPLCTVTSIDEQQKTENTIVVYPNPSSGIVNVDLSGLKDVSIKVISSSGQVIYDKENINTELFQFELNSTAGLYILILSEENRTKFVKLLKY